jgi:hypothetical protein
VTWSGCSIGSASSSSVGVVASRLFFFGRQGAQAGARLRGDHHCRPVGCDDVAEFLQHQRRAQQVHMQDGGRWRLRWRHAGGVHHAQHVAQGLRLRGQRLHRSARRDIDHGGRGIEAGLFQCLGHRVGILLVQVGHQDVAAGADAAGNGQADRAGAYQYGNLGHVHLLGK